MPNLSDSLQSTKFRAMLDTVKGDTQLTDWESKFVDDMMERFEAREDQIDIGMTPWNPTVNQWNTLHDLANQRRPATWRERV